MTKDPIVSPARLLQLENEIRTEFWRDFDAYSPAQTCETREEWMRRVQGPPTRPVFGVNVFTKMTPLEFLLGHRIGPGGHLWKTSPVNGSTAHTLRTAWIVDDSHNVFRFKVEHSHPLLDTVRELLSPTVPTL